MTRYLYRVVDRNGKDWGMDVLRGYPWIWPNKAEALAVAREYNDYKKGGPWRVLRVALTAWEEVK